jgi:hypothetical protein
VANLESFRPSLTRNPQRGIDEPSVARVRASRLTGLARQQGLKSLSENSYCS